MAGKVGRKATLGGNRVNFGRAVAAEVRRLLLETMDLKHRKNYEIVRRHQGLTRKPMTKQEAAILQEAVENVMRQGLLAVGVAFDWSGFARLEAYDRKPNLHRTPDGTSHPARPSRRLRVKVHVHLNTALNQQAEQH